VYRWKGEGGCAGGGVGGMGWMGRWMGCIRVPEGSNTGPHLLNHCGQVSKVAVWKVACARVKGPLGSIAMGEEGYRDAGGCRRQVQVFTIQRGAANGMVGRYQILSHT